MTKKHKWSSLGEKKERIEHRKKVLANAKVNQFLNQLQNTQERAQMEELNANKIQILNIWVVPDLTFKGFRYPNLSRQFVVTLNTAISKENFAELIFCNGETKIEHKGET